MKTKYSVYLSKNKKPSEEFTSNANATKYLSQNFPYYGSGCVVRNHKYKDKSGKIKESTNSSKRTFKYDGQSWNARTNKVIDRKLIAYQQLRKDVWFIKEFKDKYKNDKPAGMREVASEWRKEQDKGTAPRLHILMYR